MVFGAMQDNRVIVDLIPSSVIDSKGNFMVLIHGYNLKDVTIETHFNCSMHIHRTSGTFPLNADIS